MSADSAPRAPADDFGVLASPPTNRWGELARSNRALLETWNVAIGGLPLQALRARARADFLACAQAYGSGPDDLASQAVPGDALWFMTGHQPELYHPGVWAKNFAVAAIARSCGGFGGNLIADTDQIKANFVRAIAGTSEAPRVIPVPFDTIQDGRPFEAWHVIDEPTFRDFPAALRASGMKLADDPLIDSFWPIASSVDDDSGAKRFSLARHAIEKRWGFGLVESPMGVWAETDSVIRLFLAILGQLPRFHEIHDAKLSAYRHERKIHSRNHPVADLVRDGDWWEAPLWVWRDSAPQRHKLWLRQCQDGSGVELRIEGESQPFGRLQVRDGRPGADAVETWQGWARSGIRIRPRALVTTALCRILLTDLFVHGIGGAIYDVLGDAVFGTFFGVTMPRYAVLTATLRLEDFPAADSATLRERQVRTKRWLSWQAERICPDDPDLVELFRKKREWLDHPHEERTDRRARAVNLRRINREIARRLEPRIQEVEARIAGLQRQVLAESLVRSREFSIVLHSERRLRRLAEKIGEMGEAGQG